MKDLVEIKTKGVKVKIELSKSTVLICYSLLCAQFEDPFYDLAHFSWLNIWLGVSSQYHI